MRMNVIGNMAFCFDVSSHAGKTLPILNFPSLSAGIKASAVFSIGHN